VPTGRDVPPRASVRAETGAASAEQVALIAVVGAIIAALFAIPVAPFVGAWGEYAVCTLFGGEACERPGADGRTDADLRPTHCETLATTFDGSVGVEVLVFDVETGISYVRTERSDGNISFTVVSTDGAGVGVSSPGAGAQAGPLSVEVGAEAGVGLQTEAGQTWIVSPAGADDLQRLLLRDLAHDQSVGRVPGLGAVSGWVVDQVFGAAPDPDVTFVAGGVNSYARAAAEVGLGGETVAGAEVGLEGAVMLGTEQHRAGNPSGWRDVEYLEVDGSMSGSLGIATVGVGGQRNATHVLKIERDLDGRLTGIEIVDSVTGTSLGEVGSRLTDTSSVLRRGTDRSVIETVTVPVRTPADREVAEAWLHGADPRAFSALVADRAIVTIEERSGDEVGLGLGAKVAFGAKLGLSGSGSRTVSELVDAYYLGAPDATGARAPVPFTECLLAAG
jgi:hypothetical protein